MTLLREWGQGGRPLRPRKRPSLGLVRGAARLGDPPPLPSIPLAPVVTVKRALVPKGLRIEAGVQQVLQAYSDACSSRAFRRMGDGVYCAISQAVTMLVRAHVSIRNFVLYVCKAFTLARKRTPFLLEVFGRRAVVGWMAQYLRHGRGEAEVPRYRQSKERRALYEEKLLGYRLLPVDSRNRAIDGASSFRGPILDGAGGAPP